MKKDFFDEGVKLSAVTLSGNGALKYASSGNPFLDDFASIGRYRELRSYDSVSEDMQALWDTDPLLTLKLTLYLRTISRQEKNMYPTKTVQRGQGLKHEFILRCIWLAEHCPITFIANLPIFIEGGSWDDLFSILRYDLKLNGWENRKVNWDDVYSIIDMGCHDASTVDLVKKFMPRIRNNKSLTTDDSKANNTIARWIAWKMFPNTTIAERANKYRKFKASGNAHTWQQLISNHNYNQIDFNKLPGRVLSQMVKSRNSIHKVNEDGTLQELASDGTSFIDRHNLTTKYMKWLNNQKTVKFTGYVYELFKNVNSYDKISEAEQMTINRQFEGLLETGKKDVNTDNKFIVVKDISGSMTARACGLDVTAEQVARSMALYFSEFLTGAFKGMCINFSRIPTLFKFRGKTPIEKYKSDQLHYVGNTNFVGVAKLLVDIKKRGVSESDFPTGIICVSDGEFDSPWRDSSPKSVTNFNAFLDILREGGFSEEFVKNFKIVLWDIPNDFYGGKKKAVFEDLGDAENFFYLSGLDPAAISFIMGGKYTKKVPKTAEELFASAMDQELLNKLVVY